MYLNIVPSSDCGINAIRVPYNLMLKMNLDYGDWLVFDTHTGLFSVMVMGTILEDVSRYGPEYVFINKDSPVLDNECEVYIEPHELTIGCDPEFFIVDVFTKKLVLADKYLPHEGQIGSDGDLGELRPDYSLGPEQLVVNIRKLIKQIPDKLPYGAFPFAASYFKNRCSGFHIHLGVPIELLSFAADYTDKFLKNIISVLDYLVYIPSAALDKTDKRRMSFEYGNPSDYRINMRTLEYRCPGGFHLQNPRYTEHLLYSSFALVSDIIRNSEKDSDGWRKMNSVSKFSYLQNIYGIPNREQINYILYDKDKKVVQNESVKALEIMSGLMGTDNDKLVKENVKIKPLIEEWSNETKHPIELYETR